MADFPHFAFPFERGADGNVKVSEQGTPEQVMDQVEILVRCPVGFRSERPDFGWPWPLFQNAPLDLKALEAAIARFVPRVSISQLTSLAELATQQIQVEVSSGR
jgi:phage baseplate assembly protein W